MKKLLSMLLLIAAVFSAKSQTYKRDTIPFNFRMETMSKWDKVEHYKWYKVVMTYSNVDSAGRKINGHRVLYYLDSLKREVPAVNIKRKWTIE